MQTMAVQTQELVHRRMLTERRIETHSAAITRMEDKLREGPKLADVAAATGSAEIEKLARAMQRAVGEVDDKVVQIAAITT